MKAERRRASTVVLVGIFLTGLVIMLYPFVSNWLATRRGIEKAEAYEAITVSLSKEEIAEQWRRAEEYNEHLRGDPVKDPFVPGSGRALPENYMEVLNIEGAMGYLEIPAINVLLPIYHGVGEDVLQKGVGHIESTALPIGGKGSHAVLTGHTGLPEAKLFTDLINLETGDFFYLHILGEVLIYEVDQIVVIDPEDLSGLIAYEDRDYITLLTCTPYGVNSHRLVVRGERMYNYSKQVNIFTDKMVYIIVFTIVNIIIILMISRIRMKMIKKTK